MNGPVTLNARELCNGSGWVVDCRWPDSRSEQLLGVFASLKAANDWIRADFELWHATRNGLKKRDGRNVRLAGGQAV
jgi:hypothetical protein